MKFPAAIALLFLPAAFAQTPLPPAQPDTVLTTHSTLVVVPALVRSKSGELVFTLTAKDFILTDDGIEQKLNLEEDTGGEPLALVVVVETGGAGARQLDKYHNLGPLLEAVVGNVNHKIAVVEFDNEPRLAQKFTTNPAVIQDAINNLEPGNGGAAILDGLAFSLDLLRKQSPEYRRAILLLSETVDSGSHTKLADALHTISDTNTAIYSIGFGSTRSDVKHEASKMVSSDPTPGPPGGCMSKDPDAEPDPTDTRLSQTWNCLALLAPPLRLAKMAALLAMKGLRTNVPETVATLTGGEFFKLGDRRSLERSLMTISNHVPNRYVLTFQPQSPHPGLHAIGLHLRDYPGLTVTARSSYSPSSDAAVEPPTP
jgi:VWFA-related protein